MKKEAIIYYAKLVDAKYKKGADDDEEYTKWKEKWLNPDGSFKGGFDGCVKAMLDKDEKGIGGFKLEVNDEHPTKEDAAKALCAYIKNKWNK